jgi:hypothetical protein
MFRDKPEQIQNSRLATYDAPRAAMQQVARRFGFWEDVEVS